MNRIKRLRIHLNLTQLELASMLGIERVSLCCYETGARVPRIDIAHKIVALGKEHGCIVTMDDIFAVPLKKRKKK